MAEIIWGDVTKVIDGDTFEVNVTHYSKSNKYTYNDQETIRIAGIDAPGPFDRRGKGKIKNGGRK